MSVLDSLSWRKNILLCAYTTIHSSVDGYVGFFHFLATGNNATVNTCAQGSVWIRVLMSLGDILRSGVARSYGDSMFHLWGDSSSVYF